MKTERHYTKIPKDEDLTMFVFDVIITFYVVILLLSVAVLIMIIGIWLPAMSSLFAVLMGAGIVLGIMCNALRGF